MTGLMRQGSFSRRFILVIVGILLLMIVSALTYRHHNSLQETFEVVLPNGTKIKQNVQEVKQRKPDYSVDLKAKYDFGLGVIEYEVCPAARLGDSQFSIVGCVGTDLELEAGIRYEF